MNSNIAEKHEPKHEPKERRISEILGALDHLNAQIVALEVFTTALHDAPVKEAEPPNTKNPPMPRFATVWGSLADNLRTLAARVDSVRECLDEIIR